MACHITQAGIDRAAQAGYYLKADGTGTYMLTGAQRVWGRKPTLVYLPRYRLAGDVSEIIVQLQCLGLSLPEAQNEIANSFTIINTSPGMPLHDALIATMKADMDRSRYYKLNLQSMPVSPGLLK